MNATKFENYLKNKTYISKGQIQNYTTAATQKRIASLSKVEKAFNFDIDSIITDRKKVVKLLNDIRIRNLENKTHTPLSNAVRHYYECITGDKIDRIF